MARSRTAVVRSEDFGSERKGLLRPRPIFTIDLRRLRHAPRELSIQLGCFPKVLIMSVHANPLDRSPCMLSASLLLGRNDCLLIAICNMDCCGMLTKPRPQRPARNRGAGVGRGQKNSQNEGDGTHAPPYA